jgi:hypothetical protein
MNRFLSFLFRLFTGALFGAQLFFAAIAAQAIFPRAVAALAHSDPRRRAAADLIGLLLGRLDQLTLGLSAAAVLCAVILSRRGHTWAGRAAAPVLLAGFAALASTALVTPAIHELRLAAATASPRFGQLHAVSSLLLLAELLLLLAAVWLTPSSPTQPTRPPQSD